MCVVGILMSGFVNTLNNHHSHSHTLTYISLTHPIAAKKTEEKRVSVGEKSSADC